jgi:hypothetical protein
VGTCRGGKVFSAGESGAAVRPARQERLDALQGPPTEPPGWVPMGVASPVQWQPHGSGCLPPWPSPFRGGLRGFSAPDHPVRARSNSTSEFARDGPRELLCLLWPRPSVLGHAERWRIAVSRARSRTGSAGLPPAASTHPSPGRALARPPGDRDSPSTGGETGLRRRSRVGGRRHCRSSTRAGPRAAGCPAAPGWISRGSCAHRCAPPAGSDW